MTPARRKPLAIPAAAAIAGCTATSPAPPYRPVANVPELMESVVAHSAEVYRGSVAIIVDDNGSSEMYPDAG